MINHFNSYNTGSFTSNSPQTKSISSYGSSNIQFNSLPQGSSASLLTREIYNSADESDDDDPLVKNNTTRIPHNDSFRHYNDRIENRVNKMFRPLQQQRKINRSHHFHSPNCHHRNSLSCPCTRSYERNNYNKAHQIRFNKRDERSLHSRGSMEDFVLKQEEKHLSKQLEVQAELQHINELASFDGYSDGDSNYDADYDDDHLNENSLYEKRRSRSPSHRFHQHQQKQKQKQKQNKEIEYHVNDNNSQEDLDAQNELEQMLDLDRLEIEEMTKNLSLEDS